MRDLEPQLILPVIRRYFSKFSGIPLFSHISYLKFYTTMPVAKLASFLEKVQCLCYICFSYKSQSGRVNPV